MINAVVLDVRPKLEYEMCNIPGTINIPFVDIERGCDIDKLNSLLKANGQHLELGDGQQNVYVLCRRGNDSQRAISCLRNKAFDFPVKFYNVKGGLYAYSKLVDTNFPVY
ncbi:hypothetical protein NQ318_023075 [Aromia moschata]|uniref:Rhodanese domain-containing protein n=1 Tax=Aromia moschata TaxID=1265417 RepID=A0AAV8XLS8_9CUCU|nr:hypothetical protein NQ318_023075 [Aromia moschata]